eukprot:Mrub_07507.p1 GENE.Mrub_07507~~Mrub_07507.p1  ORF type:complete len:261 (+),score=20.54 Mrub_07507:88-783(+)
MILKKMSENPSKKFETPYNYYHNQILYNNLNYNQSLKFNYYEYINVNINNKFEICKSNPRSLTSFLPVIDPNSWSITPEPDFFGILGVHDYPSLKQHHQQTQKQPQPQHQHQHQHQPQLNLEMQHQPPQQRNYIGKYLADPLEEIPNFEMQLNTPYQSKISVDEIISNTKLTQRDVKVVFPNGKVEHVPVYKLDDIEEDEVAVLLEFYSKKIVNKRTKIKNKYIYYISENF